MISLTTKYAVRALEYLARVGSDSYTPIQTLARETDIAAPYLAKILKTLVAHGLLESKKGLHGGVRFYPSGSSITLYDIATCLQDPIVRESCFLSRQACQAGQICAFHNRWSELKVQIMRFLRDFVVWQPPSDPAERSRDKKSLVKTGVRRK